MHDLDLGLNLQRLQQLSGFTKKFGGLVVLGLVV